MSLLEREKESSNIWKALPFRNIFDAKPYQELFNLQVEQFEHDNKYHRDIHILPVHQRINHMALHFSKYVGRLVEAFFSEKTDIYRETIVDFFIISLSSANMFNLKLSEEIQKIVSSPTADFFELADALSDKYKLNANEPLFTIKSMAVYTGRLAKACESIDHLEQYSYRESISSCIVRICFQAIISASIEGIDLSKAVRTRLSPVKKKYIFHDILSVA